MKTFIKQKITVAVFSSLLAVGTISCQDDLLNPTPETLFIDQVVFDTPTRIALQANSLYSFVKVGSFLGGRYQVFSDIRADDFLNRTSNVVTGTNVWNHTLTENSQNDVVNLWTAGYLAINQINVFLAGIDANTAKYVAPTFPADYAATTVVQYKAEARLLRALCYYSLLQFYARPYIDGNGSRPGLPLRLQAEANAVGNDLARSTVDEVYTQILDDLQYAEDNLPLTYADAPLRVSRAHRNTAIALKTRVYLTMGNYDAVIREADKIVSTNVPFTASIGVAHTLNASIATVFAPPQETTESILSFPFTAQNAPGTQNQLGFYFTSEYSLNPSGVLANPAWAATDTRRTSFVVRNTAGTESLLSRKYPTGAPYTDRAPVIRYAEVLLNLAEARARTSGSSDARALALLNAVRTRSNGSAYTQATVDNILLERRIEFLGEGIRNIDIMRLNATIPGKGSIGSVPPTSPLYIWPIPSTELAANTLMTRN